MFSLGTCILVSVMWAGRLYQKQLEEFIKDGMSVSAKKEFSGMKRVGETTKYRTTWKLTYRVRTDDGRVLEITKLAAGGESSDSSEPPEDQGAVEEVQIVVLPGYPKSGIQQSTLDEFPDKFAPSCSKIPLILVVCLVLSIFLWIWGILAALEANEMYMLWVYLVVLAIMLPSFAVPFRKKMKQTVKSMVDPTEMVTIIEVNEDLSDELLEMTLRSDLIQSDPELSPLEIT